MLVLAAVLSVWAAIAGSTYEEGPTRVAMVFELGAAILLLAACLLLAFGLRVDESAVGRRPFGVTALVLVGVAELGHRIWWLTPAGYGAGPGAGIQQAFLVLLIGVFALLAAIAIGTARVVPRPWRWVPLCVLLGALVVQLLFGFVVPVAGPDGGLIALSLWVLALVPAAVLLALGVCSVAAGRNGRAAEVTAS